MNKLLFSLCISVLLISGCATREYMQAEAECSTDAYHIFPPRIEARLVNKARTIHVPDGTSKCVRHGDTTRCEQGMRHETVYTPMMEEVDINEPARNKNIEACAVRKCMSRYGNGSCDTGK